MLSADIASVELIEQQTLSPWTSSSLIEELKQERGIVLLAEQNDANATTPRPIIGWCACRYLVPEAELLKIAVRKEARKQGVASALLSNLIHILLGKNVKTLFLEVRSQNQSALSFYKSAGFLQTGTRPAYYSNPVDTALLFQKYL